MTWGGAEEPKIVWHHKLTETLHNLWLAPEKSSLIQGITLTLLLGDGGGGKKKLSTYETVVISPEQNIWPQTTLQIYIYLLG